MVATKHAKIIFKFGHKLSKLQMLKVRQFFKKKSDRKMSFAVLSESAANFTGIFKLLYFIL